jgi:hypothetical protein
MALVSSGEISIGGSTVGRSINLELGKSATATSSLNDADLRSLAGISVGTISLNSFYGKSSISYFLKAFYLSPFNNYNDNVQNVVIYPSAGPTQSLYLYGDFVAENIPAAGRYVIKTDPDLGITWSRVIYDVQGIWNIYNVNVLPRNSDQKTDPNGNVYTNFTLSNGIYGEILITKHNVNGALQWQKFFGDFSQYAEDFGRIFGVDSSGNIYIGGTYNNESAIFVAKFNTNGVLQWQKSFDSTDTNTPSLGIDSSGNVYVGSYSYFTYAPVLIKLDTNGVIQWQKYMYDPDTYDGYSTMRITSLSVDSSNNVYINLRNLGTTTTYIMKFNSAGVLQWQRKFDNIIFFFQITTDPNGNIYLYTQQSNAILIFKYNSSGVFQWQRSITTGFSIQGNNNPRPLGVSVDSSAIYCVFVCDTAVGSPPSDKYLSFVLKVPPDGSKTGYYDVSDFIPNGSFAYSVSTYSLDSAGNLTVANESLSVVTISLSVSTTSFVDDAYSSPFTLIEQL